MLEEFKIHVTEVLTQHASAILLDPEFGLPASKRRAKDAGLLLAYEKTGYDATTAGPAARSARRVVGEAAEGSGRRLHQDPALLRPGRSEAHQRTSSTPGSSGSATSAAPTTFPFFLEFIGYEDGVDEKGVEFAKKKPEIVAGSMAEFTKDRYGVDVMKVEMPINMKFVEGTKAFAGQKAYTKQEAMDHFRRTAEVATKPFIYLSAGVSNDEFTESLDLAAEVGNALLRCAVRSRDLEGRHCCLRQAGCRRRSASGSRARA